MNWVILVLISATFFSFRAIIIKELLIKNKIPPIIFLSFLLSLIFTLFFKNKINFDLSFHLIGILLIESLLITTSWLFMLKAFKKLDISTVAPLGNLSPLFLVFLSIIFLGESINLINYVCIWILIISAYALELKSPYHFLEPLKLFKSRFFIYILIALVSSSISAVLDKVLMQDMNPYTLMFWLYLFLSIISFLIILYTKEIRDVKHFIKNKSLIFVILIAFSSVVGDIAYLSAVAIPGTLIALIIPLKRFSTVIETVIGGRIFKEKHIFYKGAITIVMIFGIYLMTINS